MADTQARRLLHEVEAVFGTAPALSPVTVSADALTCFKQRTVAVREVFDNAFDEVVRWECIGFGDIRDMLTRLAAAQITAHGDPPTGPGFPYDVMSDRATGAAAVQTPAGQPLRLEAGTVTRRCRRR